LFIELELINQQEIFLEVLNVLVCVLFPADRTLDALVKDEAFRTVKANGMTTVKHIGLVAWIRPSEELETN